MKIRVVIVLLFTYLIMGCAAKPSKLYSAIDAIEKTVKHGSYDVITNANSIQLPTTIHGISLSRERFDISPEDPVIDFGEYKSNYKLFHFQLEKDDQYAVSITSFCSCFGFDKRILVPNAYVIDSNGKSVTTRMSGKFAGLGSAGYQLYGEAPESGKYYLVFAANNSNPGASIGIDEAKVNGYIPTGIMVTNSSNPYGTIMPSYEVTPK